VTTEFVWPRLPRGAALEIAEKVRAAAAEDRGSLEAMSGLSHPRAAPLATGSRVAVSRVASVREVLLEVAAGHGYPAPLGRSGVADVDRSWSLELHREMRIVPADAAAEGVWSFVALIVAPDLSIWRFPEGADDRLVGRPRNVFRRLWWRCEVLGHDLVGSARGAPLGEDELVQIFERPSLSANPAVARQIAAQVTELPASGAARSEIMRDVTKRILRTMPVRNLDVLAEAELASLVKDQIESSVRLLGGIRRGD
jgi:hypothetical protein